IGWIDRKSGTFEPLAFCPGYLRGLAFWGDYAIVGLSKQRQEHTFADLALDDRLREGDADPRCGLRVVDLRTGTIVHWLQIEGVVIELYDIAVIPRARRPMALGFKTDEIRRILTVDTNDAAMLEILPARGSAVSPPSPAGDAGEPNDVPSA